METSCHCGNIKIQVDPPSQITLCNCSICSRYNSLWGYYPPADVIIEVGELGEDFYIWGDRMLEFVRCANCGCVTHYRNVAEDTKPKIGVNFRMAAEASTAGIPVRHFNGKELI